MKEKEKMNTNIANTIEAVSGTEKYDTSYNER